MYSVTTLDIATANVLRAIANSDWEGLPIHLLVLAYTPGDNDLSELAEKTIKNIQIETELSNAKQGITVSETYMNNNSNRTQILQRNGLELYKSLRQKMKAKGYLEITKYRPETKESTIQSIGASLKK